MSGRPRFPPAAGVAVAVIAVSFAGPLFRIADVPAITASFWRLFLAVVLLLPFTRSCWPAWRTYSRRDWGLTIAAGVALGLHFALWVTSLFYTTVAASTALVTLQAVFVGLGGHFLLRDRLDVRGWLGVGIAMFGAVLIAAFDGGALQLNPWRLDFAAWSGGGRRALIGDALALAGGLGSAAYLLIGRNVRAKRGLIEYVTPVYAVGALSLALMLPLVNQPLATGLDARAFVLLIALAAIPMLLGHTVANWTMRYLPAHVVATWILLEPLGAALLAWPILSESPSLAVLAAGVVVIFGAALTVRGRVVATEPAG